MLEILKGSSKTIGIKQTLKAVELGKAKTVFIADDAEEKVVAGLRELCLAGSVEIISAESMKALGKACGIDVGAAAVGVLKDA